VTFLISASRVARITGMTHQHPAQKKFQEKKFLLLQHYSAELMQWSSQPVPNSHKFHLSWMICWVFPCPSFCENLPPKKQSKNYIILPSRMVI
jgi:hypothetical protein